MLLRCLKDLIVNGGDNRMFRQTVYTSLKKSAVKSRLIWIWLASGLSPQHDCHLSLRIVPEVSDLRFLKFTSLTTLVWSYRYFKSSFLHEELKKASYQNWFQPVSPSFAAHASSLYTHYTLFKIASISLSRFPTSMIFLPVIPTGKKKGYPSL